MTSRNDGGPIRQPEQLAGRSAFQGVGAPSGDAELAQRAAELRQINAEVRESRRAALNLMEDAVQSRKAVEALNTALAESRDSLARELAATQQLQTASASLVQGGDTGALYQQIVDAAAAILRSDYASMQTVDESKDVLRLLAYHGFDPAFGKIFEFVGRDAETACGAAWRDGRRVIVPDIEVSGIDISARALDDQRRVGIRAVQSTPLFSRAGRLLGIISTHWRAPHAPTEIDLRQFDILARQAADLIDRVESVQRLRAAEHRLRLAADAAHLTYIDADFSRRCIRSGENFATVMGYALPTPSPGQEVDLSVAASILRRHVVSNDRTKTRAAVMELLRGKPSGKIECRVLGDDGMERWIESIWSIETAHDGSPVSAFVTGLDITERKRTEEQIRLLMSEVNHRSKNLLNVVQAIARLTARGGDPATFVERLSQRIDSLAASQDLLVKNDWRGIDMRELAKAQLAHLGDSIAQSRVQMEGLSVRLTPAAAQGVGMALHELATNAVKYGALSNARGLVRITWRIARSDQPTFLVEWRERGGPKTGPPTHKGFGHTVIERMASSSVRGTVEMKYPPSGLWWRLSAPAENVLEGGVRSKTAELSIP
ncbi:HWE histidine kinase domain-containing protein [Methylocystis sp. B8]|uniref:sensor histidine kinase n=1 Tax=Methylocystis sp. B8 TaxID=544938 RepID=UPI0014854FA7|nr:HWE histidine kinase domain-containing protein [Methylocystis sp. B8]